MNFSTLRSGVALLPGTPERMKPIKEKKKKKIGPPSPDTAQTSVDPKAPATRLAGASAASGGKMSRAAKMRAVSRGDHQEQVNTALEKQQVYKRLQTDKMINGVFSIPFYLEFFSY